MSSKFDPHHIWLGIPESEQPADHYRLLGLDQRETNAAAIDNAFESRQAQIALHLDSVQSQAARFVIAELNEAHRILSDPDLKRRYDEQFPPPESNESIGKIEPGRLSRRSDPTSQQWPLIAGIVVVLGLVCGLFYLWSPNNTEPKGQAKAKPSKPKGGGKQQKQARRSRTIEPPSNVGTSPVGAGKSADLETKGSEKAVPAVTPNTATKKNNNNQKKGPTGGQPVRRPTATKNPTVQPKPVPVSKKKRVAVPPAGMQARARKAIRKTFGEKYRQATTESTRRQLAAFLFQEAITLTDDNTAQFVMFDEAVKMAIRSRSVQLIEKFAPTICTAFKVDRLDLLNDSFKHLAKEPLDVAARALLTQAAIDATNRAIERERMRVAMELVRLATSQSARIRDMGLRKQALALRNSVRVLHRQWKDVQEAQQTLQKKPKSPTANEVVGRYECLRRSQWKSGLARLMFAKSDTLRKLAGLDRQGPRQSVDQKRLAMSWLRYSQSNRRNARFGIRARHWFKIAMPSLRGLDRKMAEYELAKLQKLFPEDSQPGPTRSTPRNITVRFDRSLLGHKYWVSSIVFSADSKSLYSGGFDNVVRRWEVATGNSVVLGTKQTKQVTRVALSADGSLLAVAGFDKKIYLWDARSNLFRGELTGHTGAIGSLAISPDGKWLVSGDSEAEIRLWDVVKRKQRAVLAGHKGGVTALAYSDDSRWIVSGGRDKMVVIWNANMASPLVRLEGHGGAITSVAVAGGNRVVSAALDRQVVIWDIRLRSARMTIPTGPFAARAVALSKDGMLLAFGGQDRQLNIFDATTGKGKAKLSGHRAPITSIAFSPDSKHVATGSQDYSVRIWAIDQSSKPTLPQVAKANPSKPALPVAKNNPPAKQVAKSKAKPSPNKAGKTKNATSPVVSKRKKSQPVVAQAAFKELQQLGGQVSLGRDGIYVSLSGKPIGDDSLRVFQNLASARVVSLNLTNTKITGPGLVHISHLKSLRILRLDHTSVSDSHLAALVPLTAIETLRLFQTKVRGPGLRHLKQMKKLRNLSLPSGLDPRNLAELAGMHDLAYIQLPRGLDDAAMEHVGQLSGLRSLHLMSNKISDDGLRYLVGLTKLQMLTLPPRATDLSVEALAQLKQLRTLNLGATQITDTGFLRLKNLSAVQSLQVPKGIRGPGLAVLKSCSKLRYLQLSAAQMKAGALKNIHAAAKITTLIINGSSPFDEQLKDFPKVLPGLNTLQFNGSSVGDQSLEHLTKLRLLRSLSIHSNRLGDPGVKWVAQIGQIRQLSLLGSKISDRGLEKLSSLSGLLSLNVQRTAVTVAGIQKLRKALPKCRVFQ